MVNPDKNERQHGERDQIIGEIADVLSHLPHVIVERLPYISLEAEKIKALRNPEVVDFIDRTIKGLQELLLTDEGLYMAYCVTKGQARRVRIDSEKFGVAHNVDCISPTRQYPGLDGGQLSPEAFMSLVFDRLWPVIQASEKYNDVFYPDAPERAQRAIQRASHSGSLKVQIGEYVSLFIRKSTYGARQQKYQYNVFVEVNGSKDGLLEQQLDVAFEADAISWISNTIGKPQANLTKLNELATRQAKIERGMEASNLKQMMLGATAAGYAVRATEAGLICTPEAGDLAEKLQVVIKPGNYPDSYAPREGRKWFDINVEATESYKLEVGSQRKTVLESWANREARKQLEASNTKPLVIVINQSDRTLAKQLGPISDKSLGFTFAPSETTAAYGEAFNDLLPEPVMRVLDEHARIIQAGDGRELPIVTLIPLNMADGITRFWQITNQLTANGLQVELKIQDVADSKPRQ